MTPETIITLSQNALGTLILVASPLLLSALGIGLLVGIFQAATQINEMTLSFIPKILGLVAVMFVSGQWILNTLINFTRRLIESIPGLIG